MLLLNQRSVGVTDNSNEFHTMKGYEQSGQAVLTASMEDYLEMIYRLLHSGARVRVNDLAAMLHVKPSSASKMVLQLKDAGYLEAEKYGAISLTGKGYARGEYLLYRHNVVHKFLCLLNDSENQLEQAEKIEHYLSADTVENLNRLTHRLTED